MQNFQLERMFQEEKNRSTQRQDTVKDESDELAEIVGTKKSTRPQVVKKLWAYIKAKKLQDSKNRRMINRLNDNR